MTIDLPIDKSNSGLDLTTFWSYNWFVNIKFVNILIIQLIIRNQICEHFDHKIDNSKSDLWTFLKTNKPDLPWSS